MGTERSDITSSGEKQALFQILIEMNKLKTPEFANVFVICINYWYDVLMNFKYRRFLQWQILSNNVYSCFLHVQDYSNNLIDKGMLPMPFSVNYLNWDSFVWKYANW